MRGKITKRAVDALVPEGSGETTLWDPEVRGFGVRVRAGGARTYIVRYRPGGGGRSAPLRTVTIGRHGSPWTAEDARKEAKRILGSVEHGADPAAELSSRRRAATVADLCDRFMVEHAEAKRKPRTAEGYRRIVDRSIVPVLGKKRIADVTRNDIAKLHHDLRKTPYQANRVLAVLRKMFNLAERWDLRPDGTNPCRHVEKYKEHVRERMTSPQELAAIGQALESYPGTPHAVAAIKLLMFTGARLSEILELRWQWVDLERGEARLPDSKTGAKTIHFPRPAVDILEELPRLKDNPFVIVGQRPGSSMVNLEKPWRHVRNQASILLWSRCDDKAVVRLIRELPGKLGHEPTMGEYRKAARLASIKLPTGVTDLRLHDLRHAFASIAAAGGFGLPIIGKMLGHTQPSTTARYAHLAPDPVKSVAATVAQHILEAMEGGGIRRGASSR